MKNIVLVLVSVLTVLGSSYAQNVLDGVYEKEHFTERIPQKYPALREADVMWSRKVWREIDLRQKNKSSFLLSSRCSRTRNCKRQKKFN